MSPKYRRDPLLEIIGGILAFIFALPFILIILPAQFLRSMWLGFLVKMRWYSQGKDTLFVYSESPTWKEYIEKNILPRISSSSLILNWSERSCMDKKTLEFEILRHWGDVYSYRTIKRLKWTGTNYCPMAIVFRPWWKPKAIRFWKAFSAYKHGEETELKALESHLFELKTKR